MSGDAVALEQLMALRSMTNGKAPAVLQDELFVGRGTELALFERDLDLVEAGGASLRILVGETGAGKTMLQQAMASRARARSFVTTSADLAPDRLLHGRAGEGRALLRETVLAMHTAATGNALAVDAIVSRFSNDCQAAASADQQPPRSVLRNKLGELHARPKGSEFAKVIETYAVAPEGSSMAANCRRWLCGDYSSVSEARDDLGIGSIVDDQDFWLMKTHWASFLRLSGRPGLVLLIDEAQVLCGLHNTNARMLNLEQLLLVFNDILQSRVHGIAVVIAATPAFVSQWNGIAKHEGLSSCLAGSSPAQLTPQSDDVLVYLQDLTEEEMKDLLQRCRQLYGACRPHSPMLPEEGVEAFLQTCRNQIGEARWHNPRRVIQSFFALHDRLVANPSLEWPELLYPHGGEADAANLMFDGYAHRQM